MKKLNEIFSRELKILNIGLNQFYEDLKEERVEVIQMDWSPPAGGDSESADILSKLLD